MTDVYRGTATWTGFTGSPGYSRFHFQNLTDSASVQSAAQSLHDFFSQINTYLRSGWSVTIGSTFEVFDMATGVMTGEVTVPNPPSPVAGTGATTLNWAGGAGARIEWKTSIIFNGHRVKGRTYLVPLVGVSDVDGTLTGAAVTAIDSAAGALMSGQLGKLSVWSKQYSKPAPPNKPVQINGVIAAVSGHATPDKTGILRSRRD